MQGLVTAIQHCTVHDGPGIRTMVFLKGCPLRCAWCSNPETQEFYPEPGHNPDLCRLCGACAAACPHKAIAVAETFSLKRNLCAHCHSFACAKVCPWGALEIFGTPMQVQEILDEAEQDLAFYRHEGGGLTLSGGEALAQADFALALLARAKERHLHTALESCGHIPPQTFAQALPLVDYLLFDLKHADPEAHLQGTGLANLLILRNLEQAVHSNLPLHVRTPLIPGFNAHAGAVTAMGRLLAKLGVTRWELLPGHCYGQGKYARLHRPAPGHAALPEEDLAGLRALAADFVPDPPCGISRQG